MFNVLMWLVTWAWTRADSYTISLNSSGFGLMQQFWYENTKLKMVSTGIGSSRLICVFPCYKYNFLCKITMWKKLTYINNLRAHDWYRKGQEVKSSSVEVCSRPSSGLQLNMLNQCGILQPQAPAFPSSIIVYLLNLCIYSWKVKQSNCLFCKLV